MNALRMATYLGCILFGSSLPRVVAAATGDTVRPTLVSSTPPNGAAGVDPQTPVRFTFSEAMKSQQSILWIAGVATLSSNSIVYAWSADGTELTASHSGGWPASQKITWFFQPSVPAIPGISAGVPSFEDLAGNRMTGGVGAFTTSSGGPAPLVVTTNNCGLVATNSVRSTFRLSLAASYLQTNSLVPLPAALVAASTPVVFSGQVVPGIGSASAVLLQVPGGSSYPLTNRSGRFSRSDGFDSLNAASAHYPSGTYRFVVTNASGDMPSQAELTLADASLPSLYVTNFAALQGVNLTNPIVIGWEPITATTSDLLQVVVRPRANPAVETWVSPDAGCPGALTGTSTSVTLPPNTLVSGQTYYVDLVLQRSSYVATPTSSYAGEVLLTSTTRTQLVPCSSSRAERDRNPDDPVYLCDDPADTAVTNALWFLATPALANGQLRLRVGPTEVGTSYQLFELVLPPPQTNSATPRKVSGDPVETPVGSPVIATGTNVEFSVTVEPAPSTRLFGVGKTGGRRGR